MITRTPAPNSTYPKVAVQWLNRALCFYQILCLVDSEVLRNRHLRVAAKRYHQVVGKEYYKKGRLLLRKKYNLFVYCIKCNNFVLT